MAEVPHCTAMSLIRGHRASFPHSSNVSWVLVTIRERKGKIIFIILLQPCLQHAKNLNLYMSWKAFIVCMKSKLCFQSSLYISMCFGIGPKQGQAFIFFVTTALYVAEELQSGLYPKGSNWSTLPSLMQRQWACSFVDYVFKYKIPCPLLQNPISVGKHELSHWPAITMLWQFSYLIWVPQTIVMTWLKSCVGFLTTYWQKNSL